MPRPRLFARLGTRAPWHGGEPGDDSGFGLIEVVVAMGVLSLVALGVVGAITATMISNVSARQRSVALSLVAAADAELQAAPDASLATKSATTTTVPTTVGSVTYCTSTAPASTPPLSAGAQVATLYTFTVTVVWPATASCTGPQHVGASVQVGGR